MDNILVRGIAFDGFNEYVLILSNEKNKILPITINEFDAHSISLSLEGVKTEKPLLHDILKSICNIVDCKVERAIIEKIEDNMLYTKVEFTYNNKTFALDTRITDAILLAINNNAPIYTAPEVRRFFVEENELSIEPQKAEMGYLN